MQINGEFIAGMMLMLSGMIMSFLLGCDQRWLIERLRRKNKNGQEKRRSMRANKKRGKSNIKEILY